MADETAGAGRDHFGLLLVGGAFVVWAVLGAILIGTALLLADDSAGGVDFTQIEAVELEDFLVRPDTIAVAPNTELVIQVRNSGEIQHDLKLEGEIGTERLAPGDSAEVNLGVVSAGQLLWCTVPGHREQGMEAEIVAGAPAEEARVSDPEASSDEEQP